MTDQTVVSPVKRHAGSSPAGGHIFCNPEIIIMDIEGNLKTVITDKKANLPNHYRQRG